MDARVRNKKLTKILVVDDEQGIRDLLNYELSSQGYSVIVACDGEEAIQKLKEDKYNLVITDIKMPKVSGVKILEEVKKINPEIEVIMATGYGTIETAVDSMKKGAYDFIQKPFNVDEILSLIEKALEKAELKSLIALYEASKAVFSAIKLDELMPVLVKISVDLLEADDISIMLMTNSNRLNISASYGLEDDSQRNVRIALGNRIIEKIAEWKESCVVSSKVSKDPRFKGIEGTENINACLISLLMSKEKVVGILCAVRKRRNIQFNSSDIRYANIFSSQISQAVENAQLYEKLEAKIVALNKAYEKLSDMQKELVQAEKLAAIGELASGVAHELNNPLTVVIGLVQIMLEEGGLTKEKKDDLEVVREQAERCRKIILNLLQFARKHETQKSLVQIEDVVEKTLELVEYDLRSFGIEILRNYEKSLPLVEVDLYQMQQVFLNIINNAHHSLKDVEKPKFVIGLKKFGTKIQIQFSDNGCGIPDNIVKKIFDPFFTTKEVKKGTGLGLSISYGIIKEHGGDIKVESKEGEGTTFYIELPIPSDKE